MKPNLVAVFSLPGIFPGKLYVLLLEIYWRPIISGSTGPIFTILSQNCRCLIEHQGSGPLFPTAQGYTFIWHTGILNGLEYCNLDGCMSSAVHWPSSCKNLVNLVQ